MSVRRLGWAGLLASLTQLGACCDALWKCPPGILPPAADITIVITVDSVAIQSRDSATTVEADATGKLGIPLDTAVIWASLDTTIVKVVPAGPGAVTLIPRRPGLTQLEARVSPVVATIPVRVLDTVYSVQLTPADSLVSLGFAMQVTADVQGPTSASKSVAWKVLDEAKGRVDALSGTSATIISLDTGSVTVVATSTIDRNRADTLSIRTANPASLYFIEQPADNAIVAHAGDFLSPGATVGVRDALGTAIPFTAPVSLALAPGTGAAGAMTFGLLTQPSDSGVARFKDLRLDRAGTGYQLVASSPGLTSATSSPFSITAACPGTPYTVGSTVNGALAASSCRLQTGEYYDRYTVTSAAQSFFRDTVTTGLRVSVVFSDSTLSDQTANNQLFAVAPGTFSLLVLSALTVTGSYQMTTLTSPSLPECFPGGTTVCQATQVQRGLTLQRTTRGSNQSNPCNGQTTSFDNFRLHLPANQTATLTMASAAFDPCLHIAALGRHDDDSAGGTAARIVIAASPLNRSFVINAYSKTLVAVDAPFTLTITP